MVSQPPRRKDAHPSPGRGTRGEVWRGVDQGSIMGLELVAGILLWGGLGYLADQALGTAPWLLGIGALVGYAGGLWLIWLRSQRMPNTKTDGFDRRRGL